LLAPAARPVECDTPLRGCLILSIFALSRAASLRKNVLVCRVENALRAFSTRHTKTSERRRREHAIMMAIKHARSEKMSMRIGLLEDDPELCAMLNEMLEAGGHTVSAYLDGSEILAAFHLEEQTAQPSPFDILLVDLILSGDIDGEQVIHQVRMRYPDLPIVIISAVSSSHLETVTKRYPGIKALRKPFKLRNLFAVIEGHHSFN